MLRHRRHRLRDDLHHYLLRRASQMGRLSREHFVEYRCKRVDVRARRYLLLCRRLLGTHVVWCAEGKTGLRHATTSCGAQCERDSEVSDHWPTVREEYV